MATPNPTPRSAPSGLWPSLPLHDPRFRYTPSAKTDIRKTFAKARAAMRAAALAAAPLPPAPPAASTEEATR